MHATKTVFRKLLAVALTFQGSASYGQVATQTQALPAWQPGMLDIHFINTGRGNASFLTFPDGTTLLIDAGDLNVAESEKKIAPLKIAPAVPDSSLRPGQWIAAYIKQVMPPHRQPAIDYALITHYHGDHYGTIGANSPVAANGAYKLSGITDVGTSIPIATLLDRGYAYPVDLTAYYRTDPTFTNYRAFITYWTGLGKLKASALQAGSQAQIKLLYDAKRYPEFSVRNLKSNATLWSGTGTATTDCFTTGQLLTKGKFNENPLSNAIKVTYGDFTYYAGGDNTGYEGSQYPGRRDVETPMAKVVGNVVAMTLNHHGNRDATNDYFLKTLAPKVVVEQSWCSDQPGQEVAFRLLNQEPAGDGPQVFDLHMQPETKAYLGFWVTKGFKSLEGHVLIRVLDGGRNYLLYVLDDRSPTLRITNTFGPYPVAHPGK